MDLEHDRWIVMKVCIVYSLAFLFALAALIVFAPHAAAAQVAGDTLKWTSPGDDGVIGTATLYEMRYSSTRPDSTSSSGWAAWASAATPVSGMPAPLVSGAKQSKWVAPSGGFAQGITYYFAIRAQDDAGNWNLWSNIAWRFWPFPDTTGPSPITDLK